MPLTLHDTYAGQKRLFAPADPQRVTLYVCGPTVYNYAHVGNARPAVVFDVLQRLLRHLYGVDHVVYVRNITDVDDKINAAAAAQGVPISTITERYAGIYSADMAALGVATPDIEPRATAHIGEIVDMIGRLVQRGSAYAAQGHVLFAVDSFPDYGKLSGRTLEDLVAGARVEIADYKRNPADFVLWKPSKPGEPVWASPFGPGRPGWHIECSAMIEKTLGLPIDIHGGGHDLIFPHHENEIAQGVCAQGVCAHGSQAQGEAGYARYWMHNGFLTLDAEKMSKSLGNVLLVHDLVEKVPGEVVRWALLSAHYRAPLDWTGELIEQSRRALDRLYQVLRDAKVQLGPATGAAPSAATSAVVEALCDDLNTPNAVSALFTLSDALRTLLTTRSGADQRELAIAARDALIHAGALLGFLQADPDAWFQGGVEDDLKTRVDDLIARRGEARKAKDWTAADAIRAELTALNVEVLDGPGGTATWRLKA